MSESHEYLPTCPDCRKTGETICLFAQIATYFADNPTMTLAEKSQSIAQARKNARSRMCPHLNEIDPDYPGKNTL